MKQLSLLALVVLSLVVVESPAYAGHRHDGGPSCRQQQGADHQRPDPAFGFAAPSYPVAQPVLAFASARTRCGRVASQRVGFHRSGGFYRRGCQR